MYIVRGKRLVQYFESGIIYWKVKGHVVYFIKYTVDVAERYIKMVDLKFAEVERLLSEAVAARTRQQATTKRPNQCRPPGTTHSHCDAKYQHRHRNSSSFSFHTMWHSFWRSVDRFSVLHFR